MCIYRIDTTDTFIISVFKQGQRRKKQRDPNREFTDWKRRKNETASKGKLNLVGNAEKGWTEYIPKG